MSATPPAPIPTLRTIDEVIEAIDAIVDWSVSAESRLGYFAALYKRITIAVRTALEEGKFENGPRMERFDVAFAGHYFAALNGHFHPNRFPKPRQSWQVTFDAADRPEPIIVQHMLGGVNTHINLDLGIVAQTMASRLKLPGLHEDFNRINAVLASQVKGVVESLNEISPALADLYAVLEEYQILLINETVKIFRDSAWRFATVLTAEPTFVRPLTIWARDRWVASRGKSMYDPPGLTGLIASIVRSIAERESRDIRHNIKVLDRIASTPALIQTTL